MVVDMLALVIEYRIKNGVCGMVKRMRIEIWLEWRIGRIGSDIDQGKSYFFNYHKLHGRILARKNKKFEYYPIDFECRDEHSLKEY